MKTHKKAKRQVLNRYSDYFQDAPRDEKCNGLFAFTDLGNSWRLAEAVGGAVKFNATSKRWMYFDGTHWDKEKGEGFVHRKAMERIIIIPEEVNHDADSAVKKRLSEWARRSQSNRSIEACIQLARTHSFFLTYNSAFDQSPHLLNCQSGTINLRTGKLQPHNSADMITKVCPVEYGGLDFDEEDSPEALLWQKFLADITQGNEEYERFLQTAIGYTATGRTDEEKIFFIYGAAASGKSTLLKAIKSVLADYAITADFETFLKKRNVSNNRPDIARMCGARMVCSLECDKGKAMAEGLTKAVSGGDTIAARHLYEDYFEYPPEFKLWLAANTAPKIRDEDAAMWRRFIRLPFEHAIPEAERDPSIKARLSSGGDYGAVILSWIVRGAVRWYKHSLGEPPAIVRRSTEAYRAEQNPLRAFFDECCKFKKAYWVKRSKLYDAYEEHCRQSRTRYPLTRQKFNKRMEEEGCESRRQYVEQRCMVKGKLTKKLVQAEVWRGVKLC